MTLSQPVVDLTREDIKQGLDSGEILLIDVREPHEFAMGRIPGAVLMPLSSFDPLALPQEEGRVVVFTCAAGIRSLRAIELAQQAGLDAHMHYRGGFRDWSMSGEAIETG